MTILSAAADGATFDADLTLTTGLDALDYERTTGEPLDDRIAILLHRGAEATDADPDNADQAWRLFDRCVIAWLSLRQRTDAAGEHLFPRIALLDVLQISTFESPVADPAGDSDAPGVS